MENNKKKCFCCGKEIQADASQCPFCDAEIPVRTNVAAYNANLKITKVSLILGAIVGFFACIMFASIDPNSYIFLLGIAVGFAFTLLVGFILNHFYQKKLQEEEQMLTGKHVFSNKYGVGVVEKYDEGEIVVRFQRVRATFPYQISFKIKALRFANAEEEKMFKEMTKKQLKEESANDASAIARATAESSEHFFSSKLLSPVCADTHKDFLNRTFGCQHKGYQKTVWPYHGNSDLVVWMVRFRFTGGGWKNELLEKNGELVVRETYIGAGDTWNGKPLTVEHIAGKIRVVVGIEDGYQRKYHIYGVFKLGVESTGKCRIWKKIPDEIACKMVPEIFEEKF